MSHSPYNPLIGNSHMGRSDLSPLNSDSGRSLNSLQQPLYSPQTNPPLSVAAIHTGQTMNHASPGQPVLQSPQQSEIFGMQSPNMVASNPSPGIPVQSQHPVGDLSSVLVSLFRLHSLCNYWMNFAFVFVFWTIYYTWQQQAVDGGVGRWAKLFPMNIEIL